ncbi:hypothetical protein [Cryptosporangium arvum]|uniref:Uncharacterized protein n=1 Tax=Cryptosporangium arvum DSM 44712 TaxID=927661 RepID=A0A010ZV60_9ACTN|nr:hypothetical protein [Cryptosporangium arvum]EXG81097.1 hypothetical protein CryarDRAFT_2193 [Cryptosporangium arvum DSM 44712]
MEYIAAYFIARDADGQRMSTGRLDGRVEAPRASLWRRAARLVTRAVAARRASVGTASVGTASVPKVPATKASTAKASAAAAGRTGCATA